jgi:hypothetical protein
MGRQAALDLGEPQGVSLYDCITVRYAYGRTALNCT